MLQQTQVATVIPYFQRFITEFPTVEHLAKSDERQILRLWQGLGYYSRARNLRKAAIDLVERFNGKIPTDVNLLLTLPGVGRYTAGAIASLAYDQRAPILDGNVTRVICRLDAITGDPWTKDIQATLWARANQILPDSNLGDFNSALMELGATICTPRNPKCLLCPVQAHCQAFKKGLVEKIPAPRTRKPSPTERRVVLCIAHRNRWLIEQRPAKGRWAGLWQFITLPRPEPFDLSHLQSALDLPLAQPVQLGEIKHILTHRKYEFDAYVTRLTRTRKIDSNPPRAWIDLDDLHAYPLSKPQLSIAALLRKHLHESKP